MIDKILNFLNLHPDHNQKWLLWSMAISTLLGTYTHPQLFKTVISDLPAEWLAIDSLVMSVSGLIIGALWKGKLRIKAVKRFATLAIIESSCGFLLAMYLCFIQYNPWVYGVASLIYSSMVMIFVGKCIMCFKAKLWVEREREIYDNNTSIVSGIVCIIGYLVALVAMPSLSVALFIWGLCCIIDDIGWIIVYLKNKTILHEIEE